MAFKRPNLTIPPTETTFPATAEQVYNNNLVKEGKDVKIVAGAGTGKSSSLRYIASQNPERNFLVLCFNTANAVESNAYPGKPENIFYSTLHSLAYANIVDYTFKKKLSFLSYTDLEEFNLEYFVSTQADIYKAKVKLTRAIIDCITHYCRTDRDDLAKYAYGMYMNEFGPEAVGFDVLALPIDSIKELASLTVHYWNNLVNPRHTAKISHDIYLKLYQLASPVITTVFDKVSKMEVRVDVVCLDEAQDTNPVAQDVFSKQTHLQRVIVGDPMQQLYAWRGAGDAMNCFTEFSVGTLTESFRFNEAIAEKANFILHKAGSAMQLVGSGKRTAVETHAHLCRTNASVVGAIFEHLKDEVPIYTSIDMREVFSKLFHMQACFFGQRPMYPNKDLSGVVDKATLEQALEYSEDLKRLDKLRKAFTAGGETLTEIKKAFDKVIVKDPKDASLIITTIHASKGMEYDAVSIDEDFLVPTEDETLEDAIERLWETESLYCMLYVAVTRAKVEVALPSYLENYFKSYAGTYGNRG